MAQRVETTTNLQWQAFFNHSQVHITIPVLIVAHEFSTRHNILAFMLPTLLGFLQIQSKGNDPSPFQVYPVTSRSSVISILGYYMAFGAKRWFPTYASQLVIAMAFFGSFSVASLVSLLLLPQSWWRMTYVLCIILMVAELHQSLRIIYDKYVRRCSHWGPLRQRSGHPLLPQTRMDLMDYAGYLDN